MSDFNLSGTQQISSIRYDHTVQQRMNILYNDSNGTLIKVKNCRNLWVGKVWCQDLLPLLNLTVKDERILEVVVEETVRTDVINCSILILFGDY